jgi:hypothetical protein
MEKNDDASVTKVKDALKDVGSKLDSSIKSIDTSKLSQVYWLLIIGAYITLFWSLKIGLSLLILTTAYIVLEKKNPTKAEQVRRWINDKWQSLSERPILKTGLLGVLIGLVFYRYISALIGLIIISLTIVYLVCSKWAPKVSDKIDAYAIQLKDYASALWCKPYTKVAVWAILLIIPFMNNTHSQSVVAVATPKIEQALDITPEPEELKESNIPTFRSAWDVAGFLSGHTFRDENGHRLVIKPNSLYLNGRALTGAVNVEDFSSDEATLKAHSPFSNTTYEIWLVRTGNTYQIKLMTLPSYSSVEVFYMID